MTPSPSRSELYDMLSDRDTGFLRTRTTVSEVVNPAAGVNGYPPLDIASECLIQANVRF